MPNFLKERSAGQFALRMNGISEHVSVSEILITFSGVFALLFSAKLLNQLRSVLRLEVRAWKVPQSEDINLN